jgi:uncharacterized protein (TIGR03435 family)
MFQPDAARATQSNSRRNSAAIGPLFPAPAFRFLPRQAPLLYDQNSLTGNDSWNLKWTPESLGGPASGTPTDDAAPSLFTAVQEQLGLKLESQKALAAVLSVESMELPSVD